MRAGGTVLVVDSCLGLLTGAVLERLAGSHLLELSGGSCNDYCSQLP